MQNIPKNRRKRNWLPRVGTIKAEYENYHSSEKQKKNRAARNGARRTLMADGRVAKGDGKDVDHIKPLVKGGSIAKSNLRVKSASGNRSFKRTKKAGMA